jgi:hypothetical protein
MKQIKAGNESTTLKISFYNQDSNLYVPTSISYKVYCVTTATEIVASTSISPASRVTIDLIGDLVALQDSTNKKELKRVCLTIVDDRGYDLNDCYHYEVIANEDCSCG